MNLADLLAQSREQFGVYTSLVYEGRTYTNEDHDRLAWQWARALKTVGVTKGDRVMVVLPNRPEVIFAYTAIVRLGAVVVPVMPLLQAEEIYVIAQDSAPKMVLTSNLLAAKIEQALQGLTARPIVMTVDAGADSSLPDLAKQEPTVPFDTEVEDNDLCVLLYTSGTTGRPKGVELTQKNLYSNAKAAASLAEQFTFDNDGRCGLVVLPLSHAFGFTMMHTSIILGERDVLLPFFHPEKVFEAIETHRVTHFSAVPAMFHALLNHPKAADYDLSSLRLCICGSAPLPVSDILRFEEKFGARIYEGYGLSEAAPIVTAPRFDKYKPGSVGQPLPGIEVKVVSEDGTSLPSGEVGELAVRGPNVTCGYHNLPEETARVLREGWLLTGDMARIDEEGYVYIVERKKDVIIRGGFNIYPRDLEELLMQHPAVSAAAVVGVPSEEMGEEVVAYVVKRQKEDVSSEDLIAWCQEHLAKYKTPRMIRFVSYLPKTIIGKVDKKAIRAKEPGA
ncbi:long-chain-fatty-acid--CoA ligase [Alicyclobacillus mengziensis]|uniref:Long-chain-fatty-acid--CoA ligase n=1 Tax=Alicyclobacillus mengziensis TaxID=2931921 RepID=A0A9X7Z662_9BACL|nr:long-chain-fatty-acid--CoA ligase [Alicyclobacillus mengziensis]QSO46006.1 long-chain-fatty-acid--CoA ligase [Alicyclobacillus mengziensis]